MTWTAWYVLLPAACVVSLLAHEVNQWATRTINRHVGHGLHYSIPEPGARAEILDFEPSPQFKMPPFMGIDYLPPAEELAAWEAELERPYNWQDDGL